ncbi:MAG: hypothetical protein Unbinned3459contig1000_47 [Prokaryotic dsDNA virus sp.]|jgi:hypothetical protein|nr:MAG: hypothetical protein Unbinned3459contig1000_47 [Prokaryotic dsDNA virus sp.]|tara:strand:+ start:47 stop:190 length:144 start_codon:yes stop_codon:yes gene_type:complete
MQLTYRGVKYQAQTGLMAHLLKKHEEELRAKKELARDKESMKATSVF